MIRLCLQVHGSKLASSNNTCTDVAALANITQKHHKQATPRAHHKDLQEPSQTRSQQPEGLVPKPAENQAVTGHLAAGLATQVRKCHFQFRTNIEITVAYFYTKTPSELMQDLKNSLLMLLPLL